MLLIPLRVRSIITGIVNFSCVGWAWQRHSVLSCTILGLSEKGCFGLPKDKLLNSGWYTVAIWLAIKFWKLCWFSISAMWEMRPKIECWELERNREYVKVLRFCIRPEARCKSLYQKDVIRNGAELACTFLNYVKRRSLRLFSRPFEDNATTDCPESLSY